MKFSLSFFLSPTGRTWNSWCWFFLICEKWQFHMVQCNSEFSGLESYLGMEMGKVFQFVILIIVICRSEGWRCYWLLGLSLWESPLYREMFSVGRWKGEKVWKPVFCEITLRGESWCMFTQNTYEKEDVLRNVSFLLSLKLFLSPLFPLTG